MGDIISLFAYQGSDKKYADDYMHVIKKIARCFVQFLGNADEVTVQ